MQALENANKLYTVLTIIVLTGSSSNFNDLGPSAFISPRVACIYPRMVPIITLDVSKMSRSENKLLRCSLLMAHTFKRILYLLVQILTFLQIWSNTAEDNEDFHCCNEGQSLSIETFFFLNEIFKWPF